MIFTSNFGVTTILVSYRNDCGKAHDLKFRAYLRSSICHDLHKAVQQDQNDMVKILLENGASINERNKYNETPLHKAVRKDNLEIVYILIICRMMFIVGIGDGSVSKL